MKHAQWMGVACVFALANVYAETQKTPSDWSGFYIGSHFGAGAGSVDETFTDASTSDTLSPQSQTQRKVLQTTQGQGKRHGNITGSNLDLFAGYNVHPNASKFVMGAQVEGTLLNNTSMSAQGPRTGTVRNVFVTSSGRISGNDINATGTSINNTTLQSTFSVIGRAGLLAKPTMFVYGLLGATEGNFLASGGNLYATVSGGTNSSLQNKFSQWRLGLSAGGGAEYQISEHWSILGEYRYMHFNLNQNGSEVAGSTQENSLPPPQIVTSVQNISANQHTRTNVNFNLGQVGVVYRI